ncbi:uncharacterized protein LOC144655320 [Oculina patagonica]
MSSFASAVFKATIGLLINKARDTAAEKLKEGDVTDEKFRSLIVREIDQINSKLDGLARKDLLSSINIFKEGIAILFEVFKQANRGVKELSETDVTGQEAAVAATAVTKDITEVSLQSSSSASAKAVSLAKELTDLQLVDLDESSKELLSDAKERFKQARSRATDAFSNEGLDTQDRILAMMVRVMATLLEKVDNPKNALTPCRVCLEQLHALPAVKNGFKVALTKGFKSRFGKDERKAIISAVCDINHAIFDVTHIAGLGGLVWPLIDVGEDNVHPLRDPRVVKINQQNTRYIGYYPMQWSFGMGIVKEARGICTNTKDQFIVGDRVDGNVKVFDSDGNFLRALELELERSIIVLGVATDQDDNVYVLCGDDFVHQNDDQVHIFDKDNNKHRCFAVHGLVASRLTVVEKNSKQVFVLGRTRNPIFVVNVYEADGTFVRSFFGDHQFDEYRGALITTRHDGRVMVLNRHGHVMVYSAKGDCLHHFSVRPPHVCIDWTMGKSAIHWANEHVIVVSLCGDSDLMPPSSVFDVSIYTEVGELVNHFPIRSCDKREYIMGITMNRQGRIALGLYGSVESEILVF